MLWRFAAITSKAFSLPKVASNRRTLQSKQPSGIRRNVSCLRCTPISRFGSSVAILYSLRSVPLHHDTAAQAQLERGRALDEGCAGRIGETSPEALRTFGRGRPEEGCLGAAPRVGVQRTRARSPTFSSSATP